MLWTCEAISLSTVLIITLALLIYPWNSRTNDKIGLLQKRIFMIGFLFVSFGFMAIHSILITWTPYLFLPYQIIITLCLRRGTSSDHNTSFYSSQPQTKTPGPMDQVFSIWWWNFISLAPCNMVVQVHKTSLWLFRCIQYPKPSRHPWRYILRMVLCTVTANCHHLLFWKARHR